MNFSITSILKNRYNNGSLEAFRKFQRLELKLGKAKLDLQFLKNCKKRSVIPRGSYGSKLRIGVSETQVLTDNANSNFYKMKLTLRPRPHVSGFVCIRKHFVADSKVYASPRMRIRCVFERPHVSAKTIRIRQGPVVSKAFSLNGG